MVCLLREEGGVLVGVMYLLWGWGACLGWGVFVGGGLVVGGGGGLVRWGACPERGLVGWGGGWGVMCLLWGRGRLVGIRRGLQGLKLEGPWTLAARVEDSTPCVAWEREV